MSFEHYCNRSLLRAVSASGLPRLMARRHAGLGGILSFHRVYRPQPHEFGSEALSVAPENFRRIVRTLLDRGYRFLSMSALADRLQHPAPPTEKFVCLTFDDGFADNYTAAFAICREFGVPMTVYLVSAVAQRQFPMWSFGLEAVLAAHDVIAFAWRGETVTLNARTSRQKRQAYAAIAARFVAAPPEAIRQACAELASRYGVDIATLSDRNALTPAMIAEMRASGLVEFGAHSVHHACLARLEASAARQEIAQSKRDCEALVGTEIRHFAYPYGDSESVGAREVALCHELGFQTAVTTEGNTIVAADRHRLLALPRLTYNGRFQDTPLLDLLLSGALPTLRRSWRARPTRAVRSSPPTHPSDAATGGPERVPGARSPAGRHSAAEA